MAYSYCPESVEDAKEKAERCAIRASSLALECAKKYQETAPSLKDWYFHQVKDQVNERLKAEYVTEKLTLDDFLPAQDEDAEKLRSDVIEDALGDFDSWGEYGAILEDECVYCRSDD